jgi:hypothetical protein
LLSVTSGPQGHFVNPGTISQPEDLALAEYKGIPTQILTTFSTKGHIINV